jgi:hypothetical protein
MSAASGEVQHHRGGANGVEMSLDEWHLRCPYGKWTCADGREVIFNRSYWPILERQPGEQAKPARPGEWVESIVEDEQFWDDYSGPRTNVDTLARVNAILAEWGLPALPPAPPEPLKSKLYRSKNVDEAAIPPRQNPWAYPFGAAPKPDYSAVFEVIEEDIFSGGRRRDLRG